MIFRKHSLLKRVTLWCAGTLAVFSLITAAASFAIGYEEAKDRQDDILKEVVGMLSRDIVQQRQRNKIQELTLGGFTAPARTKVRRCRSTVRSPWTTMSLRTIFNLTTTARTPWCRPVKRFWCACCTKRPSLDSDL